MVDLPAPDGPETTMGRRASWAMECGVSTELPYLLWLAAFDCYRVGAYWWEP